jgi:hypothetical protein
LGLNQPSNPNPQSMSEHDSLVPLVQKFFAKDLIGAARLLETIPKEQGVEVLRSLPPAVAAKAVRQLQVTYVAAVLKDAEADPLKGGVCAPE